MITTTISTKVIVESQKVLNRIAAKERRVLIRTGSYGRGVERRIFRRRKKKSQPGNPPHAHAPGGGGLKAVLYAVNKSDLSVAIGPQKFPTRPGRPNKRGVRKTTRPLGKTVPQMLNEGGVARIEIDDPNKGTFTIPANYRPRPFRDRVFGPTEKFFKERIEHERL